MPKKWSMVPYEKRLPDSQYQDALRLLLKSKEKQEKTWQGDPTYSCYCSISMRFNLKYGAPLITERKVSFWRAAIGEIFAFINGARTQSELVEKWGCKWWQDWVTAKKCADFGLEPGDLGPGSYGAAFHDFPTSEGKTFNQFENIVEKIRDRPFEKTHVITPWIPQYAIKRYIGKEEEERKVVVAPCHGWLYFWVTGNKQKRLNMCMTQRSADFPVGVPANMIQYAALLMAMAQVCDLEPGEFVHSFWDAHFYEKQRAYIRKIIRREPRPLPTLTITDQSIKNIFDFRPEHFAITDYHPHPAIPDIPVLI